MAKKKDIKKKKVKKVVESGQVHVKSSFNNTLITITDSKGNVLCWSTSGASGFKGARKSSPYAAQVAASKAADTAKTSYGLQSVEVFVKGIGSGRESAVRAINASGLHVKAIKDVTPVPHNGCRPKKPRRV